MAGNILEELEFNAGDLIKVSEKIRAFDREIYDESTVMPEPGGHTVYQKNKFCSKNQNWV